MRYLLEFFESLFRKRERKKMARLSKHLKRTQDALGSLNDFIAHRKLAVDAALKAPAQHRRARAFVSGVVLGREEEALKPLMNRCGLLLCAYRTELLSELPVPAGMPPEGWPQGLPSLAD
jgi:CHAD domain-containing protein